MADDQPHLKRGVFVGKSKKELLELNELLVRKTFGHLINELQHGLMPKSSKRLKQFGPKVYELIFDFNTNSYRCNVYVTARVVFVLVAYMKKSKHDIAIPQEIIEVTTARLKKAKELEKTLE